MRDEEILRENGYEPDEIILFRDYDYETALEAVTTDGRAVYSYEKMIEYLMERGMEYPDAVDWIETNTIRSLTIPNGPVVAQKLVDFEQIDDDDTVDALRIERLEKIIEIACETLENMDYVATWLMKVSKNDYFKDLKRNPKNAEQWRRDLEITLRRRNESQG